MSAGGRTSARFSITVSSEKMPLPSGTRTRPCAARRCGGRLSIGLPPSRTVPRTTGVPRDQPASALISVLLPAPLAPTMPTILPVGHGEIDAVDGDIAAIAHREADGFELYGHAARPR